MYTECVNVNVTLRAWHNKIFYLDFRLFSFLLYSLRLPLILILLQITWNLPRFVMQCQVRRLILSCSVVFIRIAIPLGAYLITPDIVGLLFVTVSFLVTECVLVLALSIKLLLLVSLILLLDFLDLQLHFQFSYLYRCLVWRVWIYLLRW